MSKNVQRAVEYEWIQFFDFLKEEARCRVQEGKERS